MKIIIVQENLKNALAVCGRAVASSSTLAILGNVLLTTKNGMLKISATNLEIAISQYARCKVEEEGSVCLPAKLFSEVVANLPAETVTLETVSNGMKCSAGKYRTVLKTVSVDDFPIVNDVLPADTLSLPTRELCRALEGVVFAVSTNETQIELCGVYVSKKSDQILFVGTDRYRLAESKVALQQNTSFPDFSVILPGRAATEVLKLSHGVSANVQVGITENQAMFSFNETTISTRLVDAQYPEYEAIIPKEFSVSVQVLKDELSSALRAVSVFSRGSVGVSFTYREGKDGSLLLSARSQEAGESEVEVAAEVLGGSDTVLFNHRYLLDMLQFLTSEQVQVKLNSPSSPVVLSDPGNNKYRYLVMPIKT